MSPAARAKRLLKIVCTLKIWWRLTREERRFTHTVRQHARDALDRIVMGESKLRDLWEDTEEHFPAWK